MWSATIQDSSALDRKPLLGELVRDVVRQIGPARAAIPFSLPFRTGPTSLITNRSPAEFERVSAVGHRATWENNFRGRRLTPKTARTFTKWDSPRSEIKPQVPKKSNYF